MNLRMHKRYSGRNTGLVFSSGPRRHGSVSGFITRVAFFRATTFSGEVINNRANGGCTVLIQDDEKDHVIIGEAALHLALAEKEINVISLLAELGDMAANVSCDKRLGDISEARNWLKKYANPGRTEQHVPFLRAPAGLNEEKH